LKPHRKHEFTEIRLRNREREKIDYESSLLERQLTILRSEDWRKIVAPAAAERDGLKEGEVWDWEGRRERRIELLDGVLKRVRTWREAEIKMRRGMLEKKPPIVEEVKKRKRNKSNDDVDLEVETPTKRRRKGESVELPEEGEEVVETVQEEEEDGKRKSGRKKRKPTAFGQDIPKAGLLNREFQIPLEWVPEDKRL
jgi:Something about silencing, SAS, complex subunit 4